MQKWLKKLSSQQSGYFVSSRQYMRHFLSIVLHFCFASSCLAKTTLFAAELIPNYCRW